MKRNDYRQLTMIDKDVWDWKCPFIYGSRWKGDKQMFSRLARSRLKRMTQKEIKENMECQNNT